MPKAASAACRACGSRFEYVQVTQARTKCDECHRQTRVKVRKEVVLKCPDCESEYVGDVLSLRCQACQRIHANEMRKRREAASPGGVYTADFRCSSCLQVFSYEKIAGSRATRRKCDACKLRDKQATNAARLGPLRKAFAYAERECDECRRLFRPSNVSHRYCSKNCGAVGARRKRKSGELKPLPQSRDCDGCGTPFSPKSGRHRYCSSACRPSRIGLEVVARATSGSQTIEVTRDRANQVFRNFGLSTEEYLNLWASQKGACAICSRPFPNDRQPLIDHDSQSLRVRGLLCFNCNIGIGYLQHSVATLEQAIKFLESPPSRIQMRNARKS